jgi:hypothetical protein
MSTKNSNDTIRNRTRDLPACSAVPQPTAPPRAPNKTYIKTTIKISNYSFWKAWHRMERKKYSLIADSTNGYFLWLAILCRTANFPSNAVNELRYFVLNSIRSKQTVRYKQVKIMPYNTWPAHVLARKYEQSLEGTRAAVAAVEDRRRQ